MIHIKSNIIIALILSLTSVVHAQAQDYPYHNELGSLRPYQGGDHVNAHHGGIIYADGLYWWYGKPLLDKGWQQGGGLNDIGVVAYYSDDLVNWKYKGVILSCVNEPGHELEGPMRFARAKIIFNDMTKKYVMWFHYAKKPGGLSNKPGGNDAGVAVSDKVHGPYRWVGYHRPIRDDWPVLDSTLFKDRDGSAYFIYECRPLKAKLVIVKLSDDYLSSTEEYVITDINGEAPAAFRRGDTYYLVYSQLMGWNVTKHHYNTAKSIMGPWSERKEFCVGERGTQSGFDSQVHYIFKLPGKEDYLYMGDRWNHRRMKYSEHVWLPLQFDSDGSLSMKYFRSWSPAWYRDRTSCVEARKRPDASENLALAPSVKISASSNSGHYVPKRACDGDPNTSWLCEHTDNRRIGQKDQWLMIEFGKEVTFNRVIVNECLLRIDHWRLERWKDDKWDVISKGRRIGFDHWVGLPETTTSKLRLFVEDSSVDRLFGLCEVGVYLSKGDSSNVLLNAK